MFKQNGNNNTSLQNSNSILPLRNKCVLITPAVSWWLLNMKIWFKQQYCTCLKKWQLRDYQKRYQNFTCLHYERFRKVEGEQISLKHKSGWGEEKQLFPNQNIRGQLRSVCSHSLKLHAWLKLYKLLLYAVSPKSEDKFDKGFMADQ